MEENLSDALIMAGAILIFIIALSVSMSSFTVMRTQIDEILEYDSKLDLVKDDEGDYLNYMAVKDDSSAIRTVGIETVVSSMYRVAKENYVVYIKASDLPSSVLTNIKEPQKDNMGKDIITTDDKVLYIDINGKNSNITALLNKTKGSDTIYEILARKKFKEYLGVYQEASGASQVNRTTYRVITYVEV